MYPQWLLKTVKIECSTGVKAEFPCATWFGKSYGRDHTFQVKGAAEKVPRTSIADRVQSQTTKRASQADAGTGKPKQSLSATAPAMKIKKQPPKRANLTYTITVKTGNVAKAGTDAKISIEISGDMGRTLSPLGLDKSTTNTDKFEKGKTDIFEFPDIKDLGDLKKIKLVSSNSRGKHLLNPQWNVESIEIATSAGGKFFFSCEAWLSKKAGLVQSFTPTAGESSNGAESDDDNVQSFANKGAYNNDDGDDAEA